MCSWKCRLLNVDHTTLKTVITAAYAINTCLCRYTRFVSVIHLLNIKWDAGLNAFKHVYHSIICNLQGNLSCLTYNANHGVMKYHMTLTLLYLINYANHGVMKEHKIFTIQLLLLDSCYILLLLLIMAGLLTKHFVGWWYRISHNINNR